MDGLKLGVSSEAKKVGVDCEGETFYLKECPRCGNYFVTYDPNRQYCHYCVP